jgi:hypothetical protein
MDSHFISPLVILGGTASSLLGHFSMTPPAQPLTSSAVGIHDIHIEIFVYLQEKKTYL